jgi:N-acetylglucosaminyldiphosphoundecaprenol N-acetyl-beta-D-mannosaminyltransferase
MVKRFPIIHIGVDSVDMDKALHISTQFIESGDRLHTVFASNPEKCFQTPKDPLLNNVFSKADLLIPDGIGMVLAARLLYSADIKRVPGCEFMQNLCELSARNKYKIFIYGATEEVNESAVKKLKERYPEIMIVGRANGYISEDQMDSLVDRINASGAQILFLALGSPKQEKWISTYQKNLKHVRLCQGIGGTLDVIVGTVKRAPVVFRHTGLEWLYRLISEPKRLKRQLVLPLFAYRVILLKFRKLLNVAN